MAHVEGLEALLQRFADLPGAVATSLDAELAANVEKLQRDAVDLMPSRTGTGKSVLGSAEAIKKDKSPDTGGVRYTFGFITPAMRKAAYYLFWVEFGTKGRAAVASEPRRRGKKAKKGKRAVPARKAQPFFRPAVVLFHRRMEQQKSLAKVGEAAKAAVGWLSK